MQLILRMLLRVRPCVRVSRNLSQILRNDTPLSGTLPARLERVAGGQCLQTDDCGVADPLGSQVQVMVDEALGKRTDMTVSKMAHELIGRSREGTTTI